MTENSRLAGIRSMLKEPEAQTESVRSLGRRYEEHSARLDAAARDAVPQFFQRLGLKANGEPDKCPECGWFKGLHNAGCSRVNEGRAAAEVPR